MTMISKRRATLTTGWLLYLLDTAVLFLLRINAMLYYIPLVVWGVGIAYLFTQFGHIKPESTLGGITVGSVIRAGYGLLIVGVLLALLTALSTTLQPVFVLGSQSIYIISGIIVFIGTLFEVVVVWWLGAWAGGNNDRIR